MSAPGRPGLDEIFPVIHELSACLLAIFFYDLVEFAARENSATCFLFLRKATVLQSVRSTPRRSLIVARSFAIYVLRSRLFSPWIVLLLFRLWNTRNFYRRVVYCIIFGSFMNFHINFLIRYKCALRSDKSSCGIVLRWLQKIFTFQRLCYSLH